MLALVKGADPLVKGGVLQWEMQWLDEPKLGTGCQAGTEQPIRGVKPGRNEGPREAGWIVSPPSGARGRWRLRHPDPLDSEGGVGMPESGPAASG